MPKTGTLQRLAKLYGMVERMRSVELRVAAAAVDEMANAERLAEAHQEREGQGGRVALAAGDSAGWQVWLAAQAVGEARMAQLAEVRVLREGAMDEAARVHRASRLQAEQMGQIEARWQAEQMLDEGRRMQAEADDRFASRGAWRKQQVAREGA